MKINGKGLGAEVGGRVTSSEFKFLALEASEVLVSSPTIGNPRRDQLL